MGLKCSPDISQVITENVLSDIDDADFYLDDVGAFSNDWKHHINLYPPFWIAYAKMASPLTHSNVNWLSKKLTGLATCLVIVA